MQDILKKIKLLALDVDGVLTDGKIIYNELGQEFKCFNAKDGQGLAMLTSAGFDVAIITARTSAIVTKRAEDLGIKYVFQGVKNKAEQLAELLGALNLAYDEVAYMGDDLPDIPVLEKVGLRTCPNDAVSEVRKLCNFIAKRNGGEGAVRELTDMLYPFARLKLDKMTRNVDLPTFK